MYRIDNEKFGVFLSESRKEQQLTQKDLAERLFLSDKTVSKWERGAGLPNVSLLIPLAEVLGLTVTELLRGERLPAEQSLRADEVEGLVVGSLDLSVRGALRQRRRGWVLAFFFCLFLVAAETLLLYGLGLSFPEIWEQALSASGLLLLFGGWLCLFAKERLPAYYDENKVNYYTQGIFRVHLAGFSFNNQNWGPVCTVLKLWTLALSVLFPLVFFAVRTFAGPEAWTAGKPYMILVIALGILLSVYALGNRKKAA